MHIGVALRAGKPAAFRKAQIRGKMRTASAGGQQGIWRHYWHWQKRQANAVMALSCIAFGRSNRQPFPRRFAASGRPQCARAGKATMCKAICALRLARATIQSACNQ